MMWVIIILVLLMILVLKINKKYHLTWYWCQNIRDNMVEKRIKKFGQGPPLFRHCPKEINFFSVRCSLREAIHRKIKREKKRKTGAQKIFLKPPDWWRAWRYWACCKSHFQTIPGSLRNWFLWKKRFTVTLLQGVYLTWMPLSDQRVGCQDHCPLCCQSSPGTGKWLVWSFCDTGWLWPHLCLLFHGNFKPTPGFHGQCCLVLGAALHFLHGLAPAWCFWVGSTNTVHPTQSISGTRIILD